MVLLLALVALDPALLVDLELPERSDLVVKRLDVLVLVLPHSFELNQLLRACISIRRRHHLIPGDFQLG